MEILRNGSRIQESKIRVFLYEHRTNNFNRDLTVTEYYVSVSL